MNNLPVTPDSPEIELHVEDTGAKLTSWTEYSFNQNFLTPSDGFSFSMSGPQADLVKEAVHLGNQVTLRMDGLVQSNGYIDEYEHGGNRHAGSTINVMGRDVLSPMVDGSADPTVRYPATATFLDLLVGIGTPYGWTIDQFLVNFEALDQQARTGTTRGLKTSKKGKPLKSYTAHLEKPYPSEGAFAFMARVAQRYGLWIWTTANGNALIVGQPDFDQEPLYSLRRLRGDETQNNILDGRAKRSTKEQPSLVIAEGFSGGGAFGRSRIKAYAINPAIDGGNVASILAKYPDAIQVTIPELGSHLYKVPFAKPLFLHDEESKTSEQLQNYVKRELALKMRKSFEYSVTVQGHVNSGVPWQVNAMVDVQDDVAGVHEPLWILDRTFTKSRSAGTMTHLQCIRPGTLQF